MCAINVKIRNIIYNYTPVKIDYKNRLYFKYILIAQMRK